MKVTYLPFTKEMVQAILGGRKTVTRRPMKDQPPEWCKRFGYTTFTPRSHISGRGEFEDKGMAEKFFKQHWFKDDLIYVRETWGVISHEFDENGNMIEWSPDRPALPVKELKYGKGYYTGNVIYRADGEMRWCDDFEEEVSGWHPSIHMPRTASRLTLKVTDVRVERVQDITEDQAKYEGVAPGFTNEFGKCPVVPNYRAGFFRTWNNLYNDWDQNPYVWVIEFEVIHQNVDEYLRTSGEAA